MMPSVVRRLSSLASASPVSPPNLPKPDWVPSRSAPPRPPRTDNGPTADNGPATDLLSNPYKGDNGPILAATDRPAALGDRL